MIASGPFSGGRANINPSEDYISGKVIEQFTLIHLSVGFGAGQAAQGCEPQRRPLPFADRVMMANVMKVRHGAVPPVIFSDNLDYFRSPKRVVSGPHKEDDNVMMRPVQFRSVKAND